LDGGARHVEGNVEGNLDTCDSWLAPVDLVTWSAIRENLVFEQLLIANGL